MSEALARSSIVVELDEGPARAAVDTGDDRPRFPWGPVALGWLLLVAFLTVAVAAQHGGRWQHVALGSVIHYTILALLMGLAWLVLHRIATPPRPWPVAIGLHLSLAVATLVAWAVVEMIAYRLIIGPAWWRVVYSQTWMFQGMQALLSYIAALGLLVSAQANQRARAHERRQARLALLARDAELEALRGRLQPHFLFNALNSILALVDTDPARARAMLVRLADLLRSVLEQMDDECVPLEREIALLEGYLEIERVRFGSRLTAAVSVADAARPCRVPPFLLQPLVENAIRHGVTPYSYDGTVAITADLVAHRLHIEVRDSGPGPKAPQAEVLDGPGGLGLTRRRIRAAYGARATLTLDARTDGFRVVLDLPVHP